MTGSQDLLDLLGIRLPLLQAPMAGVSTPALAAAVSNTGGLGALGLGAAGPEKAGQQIAALQALSAAPFNANFFCHAPPLRDAAKEAGWIRHMAPVFARFGVEPPERLREIYRSFRDGDAYLDIVLDLRPPVVSFHFGLPRPEQIQAMRSAGLVMIATATSLAEARAIEDAGLHAIVAQGWQAGGHRGIFDPQGPDTRLSTRDLLRALSGRTGLPVIAAGGIMDGRDIRSAISAGADAAQLGTAFIGCPESAADAAYRDRLALGGDTVMTPALSGRPARCLGNAFTEWAADIAPGTVPAYPCAYDLAKALDAAARAGGATAYAAQWAGTGASRARAMPAAELVERLAREIAAD